MKKNILFAILATGCLLTHTACEDGHVKMAKTNTYRISVLFSISEIVENYH